MPKIELKKGCVGHKNLVENGLVFIASEQNIQVTQFK